MEAAPAQDGPLQLEGGRSWRRGQMDEDIDALPYIDMQGVTDQSWKKEVERMIADEMKRSTKKPADYLAELPPAPTLNFENCPLLAKEYERVKAGKPPIPLDNSRYKVDPPIKSRQGDLAAWRSAVANAQAQLRHQEIRIENLDLMLKYGANAWLTHNQHLDATSTRLQGIQEAYRDEIDTTNKQRKSTQESAAFEIDRLSSQWLELVRKNLDISAACQVLEEKVDALRQEGAEKNIDLRS
ncbi:BCAS2 [Klebsormidium nitens]|uniref:BCAS2 n=1 Tax=Klebsormidium nitens TaxID=105231 RepID=A0A1Y1I6E7_KLENI|nr:BCAS2 [Klebsormidium nitens]|eukprot:GAQ86534.1 BCAS2 [Klebsormidium nitens]